MANVRVEALVRLGDAIRLRRESLSLSQETVSELAAIDRSYLAQIEAGRRNPSYLLLLQIAYALQTRLRDLVPQDEMRPESLDERN